MKQINRILEHHSYLKDDLESVKQVMEENLRTGCDSLDVPLGRFLEKPGKMLRPLMVLISSRFGPDRDPGKIHRLAAAVEILHIASLVHDDIIDEAPKRRGITTLHTSEGIKKAVLLGDFMFTRSISLVADAASRGDARYLAAAVSRICESEIGQHWNGIPGKRDYRRRIAGKTAMLFTLGLSAGALECGADDETVQNLRRVGYAMGMSFQIVDDILDYTAEERGTGKPAGQDLNSGLDTLPLLLAVEAGDENVRRMADRRRTGRRGIRRLQKAVMEAGGVEMARSWSTCYDSLAARYLNRLPDIPARAALEELTRAASSRNN